MMAAGMRLGVAVTILAVLGAVAPAAGVSRASLPAAERKLDARLARLARAPHAPAPRIVQRAADGRVRVYVRVDDPAAIDALRAGGLDVESVAPAGDLVQGLVAPGRLAALAELPAVRSIRPPLRARVRVGSATTEGDAAARADQARAEGFDGTGVTVGVISDGIDSLAQAQASGDLGAVGVPPGCAAGTGTPLEDEGTAILEIVHDLAPGAGLLFATGFPSGLAFVDAVDCLRSAGAQVIVDDLGFFDEPFFADGPVAQAAAAATAAGVSFHSAAGNDGDLFYEATFVPGAGGRHDFGGGDTADDIGVRAGDDLLCVLQWDDPFGAAADDYDLVLRDTNGTILDSSTTPQTGTQDPLEFVEWTNGSSAARTVRLEIVRVSGAVRRLKLFCLGAGTLQYVTPTGSVFGHPAVPGVVAVGAIDVTTPGLGFVEPYGSRGPATIAFPGAESRPKPDLCGFDGVSISNAGGFPQCPPFCRFFGTSAAAPHTAAVAALLLQKNPFLVPSTVQAILRATAVDVGAAGVDDAAGHGRLDALAALDAANTPACFTPADCPDDGDACTVATCPAGLCVVTPLACDDADACNGVEGCDPASGCTPGTPPVCDDGDACTTDACDAQHGCTAAELPGLAFVGCALDTHLRPLIPDPGTAASRREAKRLTRLARLLDRADALVVRAADAPPGRARKALRRARRRLAHLAQLARRHAGGLDPTTASSVSAQARALAFRVDAVRERL
jgi:subtilisin family serine protease